MTLKPEGTARRETSGITAFPLFLFLITYHALIKIASTIFKTLKFFLKSEKKLLIGDILVPGIGMGKSSIPDNMTPQAPCR
jgi:hypothetical protein